MVDTERVTTRVRAVAIPWFRRNPALAAVVAAALFAAILVLRLAAGDAEDAYSMLYVLPVALLAVGFGLRGGLAGGLLSVGLMIIWVLARDVTLSPSGWLSRALPVILLGALLGQASDRLLRSEAERRSLAEAALLHRQAIEINDVIVQGMAAAKWSLEAGRVEAGLLTLDETLEQAQQLVSGLIREAGMDRRSEDLDTL